jgi:single-strand DNA-binding protein
MSYSVNKVILLGNVGKDPNIRSTPSGVMVANLSIATSKRVKDASGNWNDKTEWHNLVAFSRHAEVIRDYVRKGSKLYIEGELQTQSWDDRHTGEKKYKTQVMVDVLLILDKNDVYPRDDKGERSDGNYQSPNTHNSGSLEITDDDIPF